MTIFDRIERGDIRVTPELPEARHPWKRSTRYAHDASDRLIRPRPNRSWTEYPPIARVVFDPPVPIIRCIERR